MHRYTREALVAGLLLLLPVAAVSAYAQGMPAEVSGTYVNAEAGVEITFPDGWSGFEINTPEANLVTTSPGGLSESDPETMKTITLMVADKGVRDVNDPGSFNQDVDSCNPPSIASRTVAGVQGTELTVECPETAQKFRMVAVETADSLVAVMFMSPASEFDSNIGAFDSAVASLQVEGATGSGGIPTTPTEEEPGSSMMDVMVAGESVAVSVESSSTISALSLNEGTKTLSFKADGNGDETVVSVGKVLEGPYSVMVDGAATTDFEESTDDQGVKSITVPHGTGAHDVTVTGTQVVPEFPVVVLAAVAAAIGAVSVIGRTRLLKR
jgi:hypothetical protein